MFGCGIMNQKRIRVYRRADFLLAGAIVLTACGLGIFLYMNHADRYASYVIIEQNGSEISRFPVGTERSIRLEADNGGYNLVQITENGARMAEADCRDQVCVHQGEITRTGETVICLPHKLVVRLEGAAESGPDAITD